MVLVLLLDLVILLARFKYQQLNFNTQATLETMLRLLEK
jgi:hypothetical protein